MPEQLDPAKFHTLSAMQKKAIAVGLVFTVFGLLPLFLYSYYKFAISRPSQMNKEITFEIKKGDSAEVIAKKLIQENAINSEFLFNMYISLNNYDKSLQAGVYTINPGASLKDIVVLFQHGVIDKRITFLEGWRVEEYARAAEQVFSNIDYDDFVGKATGYEGYLFPDTYYLREDAEEQDLIDLLKSTFSEKTSDILTVENLQKASLTKAEAVTFASIVEREVSSGTDRAMVAGILIKRWREGMKIDADATTQYAVSTEQCTRVPDLKNYNWWPKELTLLDLENSSPYNTRKNAGLPPAPIASVSVASLQAVLNAAKSPYYFYLTDTNGITHYARTLEEHNANVQKYLQ